MGGDVVATVGASVGWKVIVGASVGWEWCTNGERSGAIGTGAANSSSWSVRNDPLWDSSLDDARGVYMDCAALISTAGGRGIDPTGVSSWLP